MNNHSSCQNYLTNFDILISIHIFSNSKFASFIYFTNFFFVVDNFHNCLKLNKFLIILNTCIFQIDFRKSKFEKVYKSQWVKERG